MKITVCFVTLVLLFSLANIAITDNYTPMQPGYDAPHYSNPYHDPYYNPYYDPYYDPYYPTYEESIILTPVNPSYTINPQSIITVPNPPPIVVYPNPPNYYPYPDYTTYPINLDRNSDYYTGLSTYYVGEDVHLDLTAVEHGEFYLFVVDPNGSVRKLIPNYHNYSSYKVTRGRNYRFPEYGANYKLRAIEPRGHHKLIGLLVASHYGSYDSYGSYGSSYFNFNNLHSESDLSSRINNLRHYDNVQVFRYETNLLVR